MYIVLKNNLPAPSEAEILEVGGNAKHNNQRVDMERVNQMSSYMAIFMSITETQKIYLLLEKFFFKKISLQLTKLTYNKLY